MKFKYKKYGPGVLRPVIPIEILANDILVSYEVLIDSGADLCIFDAQIAEILGIDLVKGERKQVTGVTGIPDFYYLHPITIIVGGWKYNIEVGFMTLRNSSYGIVGQKGFFEKFKIIFDYSKAEIEIRIKSGKD